MITMRVPHGFIRGRIALFAGVSVLVALQGVATISERSERWVGHWPNTSATVGWAALWGSCLIAAATAWTVAAPRRGRYEHLLATSSRTRLRVYAPGLVTVLCGGLAGYLADIAYVAIRTAPEAVSGHADILEMLPLPASALAAVGTGAVCGRFVPPLLAPVVAAVVPYIAYMWVVYTDVYTDNLFFQDLLPMDDTPRDYLTVPAELLVSKTILALAVGVALLAWTLAAGRTAYGSAVVAGFALAAMFTVAGARADLPSAYAAVCTDGPPRTCVDRAHEHLADEYRRLLTSGIARLDGVDLTDVTFVQSAELLPNSAKFAGRPVPAGSGFVVVPLAEHFTMPAHSIDERAFPAYLGTGLFFAPCVAATTDGSAPPPGQRTAVLLYHWWLTVNGLPTGGGNFPGEVATAAIVADDQKVAEGVARFTAMSGAERGQWFSQHKRDILTCGTAA
ncbi:hypothetical protein [Dactylosporangium sp. NPDC005555]|uniref:hypothetical protein n=1 Tax=Dactylosporangium sp. NPDC005555 TaxID=3154889 RepID=UPI0033B09690